MTLDSVSCLLELGTDVAGHRLSMTGPSRSQVQCRKLPDRCARFVGVVIERAMGNARWTTFVAKWVERVEAVTDEGEAVSATRLSRVS